MLLGDQTLIGADKQLLFNTDKYAKTGRPMETLDQRVLGAQRLTADKFYQKALKGET
jgi:hypothetical protein